MCGLRSLLHATTICLTGICQAPSVTAQTAELHLFAGCAGRLSALMEHQWLLSDPAAEQTERQRDAMLALVAALAAPGTAAEALDLRVAAKAVQADLLARARFGEGKTAALAARRSEELLGQCRSLLLG